MKCIIIEGTDRTGKNSICKSLFEHISDGGGNLIYRHWGFPQGSTNQERIEYQKFSFKKEFDLHKSILNDDYYKGKSNSALIWNRAHLGEAVYGKLYRDYDPSWIYNLEALYGFDQNPEIYLILLEADADFICHNDDGKSFTNEVNKKQTEIDLFNQAFEKSIIPNKIKIKVNEGHQYRDSREIIRRVLEFTKYQ
jgi:thymidylate kinase